jgi:hypothetical protein
VCVVFTIVVEYSCSIYLSKHVAVYQCSIVPMKHTKLLSGQLGCKHGKEMTSNIYSSDKASRTRGGSCAVGLR